MTNPYNRVGLTARLRQLGLAVALVGSAAAAHAQALPYTAGNVTNYANPTGFIDLGTNGTVINTSGNFDDATVQVTPSPAFSFTYNGAAYSDFYFNTNGFIQFGTTAPPAATFPATAQEVSIGGALATLTNVLSPLNADLEAGSSTPEYRYNISGTAPFRVLTIQWKNISDKSRRYNATTTQMIAKQYANFSFQVKLYETTNSIDFVYGTATVATTGTNDANFTSVGLKGSGAAANQAITVIKASNIPWSQAQFQQGLYAASSNGVNLRREAIITGGQVTPEPGRTFNFAIPVANDAAVQVVYGFDKLVVPAGQPATIQARIRNSGTTPLSNIAANLTVSGANNYASSTPQTVTSLAAGATAVINFPGVAVPNTGTNTVTVTLANDGNNSNNSASMTMVTDATTTSFITPNSPAVSGIGGGGSDQYYGAKITLVGPRDITAVNAYIGDAEPVAGTQISTVGQTLYAVVVDATTGSLLSRSPNYVVPTGGGDQVHTFQLSNPVGITGDVIIGMAQIVDPAAGGTYFPMGVQSEIPTRANTFFNGLTSGGTPSPALTSAALSNYKYMLEAVTAAPATCPTPSNISVANITQTSVEVSFTGPSNGTSYQVVYVPTGTTPTASSPFVAGPAAPITVTGLSAGRGYDIYVRSLCVAPDQSFLAGPTFFSTPCTPPTITAYPYAQNFDNVAAGQDLPCGVTVSDENADGVTWEPINGIVQGNTTLVVARSAPFAMTYLSDPLNPADDWFFLPTMRFAVNTYYKLSFYYRNNSRTASLNEALEVKYGTGSTAGTAAGQTNLLWSRTNIGVTAFTLANETSSPSVANIGPFSTVTTGVIGFHCNSQADRVFLAVDDINVTAVLSTSEALQRAVNVYPNPSLTGAFTLDVRGADAKGNLQLEVTNMLGQRVFSGSAKDNFSTNLNLSNLPAGIYSLTVRNGNEHMQQQLSIVK